MRRKKKSSPSYKKKDEKSIPTCWTCDRTIFHQPYVKCTKCPEFDQCIECFSTGATVDGHSMSHPFMILDYMPENLYTEDWTAEEEGLLLVGIQMNGIGNWHEICKVVKTKSAAECEYHYFCTYIDTPTAPLPPDTLLPKLVLPPAPEYDTKPRDSRPSISNEYNLMKIGKTEATTPAEFAGWMPKRNEFEIEYINEAEELISEMTFSESDSPAVIEQKIFSLKAYNSHIQERIHRKKIVFQWGLDQKDVTDLGGETPAEREFERSIMPMAQCVSKQFILDLTRDVEEVMRSQKDMQMLLEWRKNGIATIDEGFLYNRLMTLLNTKNLTEEEVEAWNKDITQLLKSTEFRATIDREIMSYEENNLTRELRMAPNTFLRTKDLLIREYELRNEMNEEMVKEIFADSSNFVIPIYKMMKKNGFFLEVNDFPNNDAKIQEVIEAQKEDLRQQLERRELEEKTNRHQKEQLLDDMGLSSDVL